MLGPVFSAEMLRAGRRGRAHVLRWIYAGWLCAQLLYVFDATHAPSNYGAPRPAPTKAAAEFGRQTRDLILSQQFMLIVLVTPAFVAGAVTDEKTRGTLQGLLTAYVTPADIVLGKLAARTAQVGILALTPLPLLAVVGQYSGVTPEFLIALVAVTALLLFGLGGVSMLASVWLRQTRSAAIASYVGLVTGRWVWEFLTGHGWLPPAWGDYFGLIRVLDPLVNRDDSAEAVRRVGQAAAAWGSLGVVTTALAVWRLRPAYLRQMEARPRRLALRGFAARPRPVRDVVAWKECYVGRRVPLWIGVPLTAAVAAGAMAVTISWTGVPSWRGAAVYVLSQFGVYVLILATLIVGVRCSGCITGERERHTWDGLMTSPLSVREIVRGKHRGALQATWPYLLAAWFGAAAVAGMAMQLDLAIWMTGALCAASCAGLVMGLSPRVAWWVSLALVLLMAGAGGIHTVFAVAMFLGFTWMAMYFLGAMGMACTARSNSSWRSLLATVVLGYCGGTVLGCVSSIFGCVLSLVGAALAEVIARVGEREFLTLLMPLGYLAAWGLGLWWSARLLLRSAEEAVLKRDRIPPEWVRMIEYDMPRHGGSRSRR